MSADLLKYVRSDGTVAIRHVDGTIKNHWPIDARDFLANGAELADEPSLRQVSIETRVRDLEIARAPKPLSPRDLTSRPARMPGQRDPITGETVDEIVERREDEGQEAKAHAKQHRPTQEPHKPALDAHGREVTTHATPATPHKTAPESQSHPAQGHPHKAPDAGGK